MKGPDQLAAFEAMNKLQDWYDRNREKDVFLRTSPGALFGRFYAKEVGESIEKESFADVEKRKELSAEERERRLEPYWKAVYELLNYRYRWHEYHDPVQQKVTVVRPNAQMILVAELVASRLLQWAFANIDIAHAHEAREVSRRIFESPAIQDLWSKAQQLPYPATDIGYPWARKKEVGLLERLGITSIPIIGDVIDFFELLWSFEIKYT